MFCPKRFENNSKIEKWRSSPIWGRVKVLLQKPVVLNLIHSYSKTFVTKGRTIETVPNLYDRRYLDTQYNELLEACAKVNTETMTEQATIIVKILAINPVAMPFTASKHVKLTQFNHPIPLSQQCVNPIFSNSELLLQNMAASMKKKSLLHAN